LCRIATNLAIDTLRRQRLLAWFSLDQAGQEPEDEQHTDPQAAYTTTEAISAALARLSPSYRRALLLRAQGYRLTEIADQLGIAHSGIKMHLLRARHAFQKQYQLLQSEEQGLSPEQSSPAWSLTFDCSLHASGGDNP
jgi:RNA polymerase sigma factor (sigma-70 family)